MEKEFHIYLGKDFSNGKELGIMLYVLADKNSDYNLHLASSIMEKEGFLDGAFYKVGKKDYNEISNDENFSEYFESALEFGYCIVKYT